MKKFILGLIGLGCFLLLSFLVMPGLVKAGTIPTISIVSVIPDDEVTIQTHNYPANQTFTVRMGAYGTKAINGVVVGTTDSGKGGSFKVTYKIPATLKGSKKIAIRMDSPQGYYSYNWFDNIATQVTATTPAKTAVSGYTGIPTISIESVEKDIKATIKGHNFPANQKFTVLMGAYGTKGIGGKTVGTYDSGSGSSFSATYDIPDSLKGMYRIAIRLESTAGYYSYNWFYNNTSIAPTATVTTPTTPPVKTVTPTPHPGYTGIPTISISTVVKDSQVTIKTNNFPTNQTFTVRMGAYGTKAIGGTTVGTYDSGAGGTNSVSFNIPDGLKGASRIAIRLDSPAGYYTYNWFYNVTYP